MRRCLYAVVAMLVLSPFALGRGGHRSARRMVIPTTHVRLQNVQNVPQLMGFIRHPYDRTVSAISLSRSGPSADAPELPRMPYAAERLPSRTLPEVLTPRQSQPKLLDSAGDIIRCGYSPSSGCVPSGQNYRTVAY